MPTTHARRVFRALRRHFLGAEPDRSQRALRRAFVVRDSEDDEFRLACLLYQELPERWFLEHSVSRRVNRLATGRALSEADRRAVRDIERADALARRQDPRLPVPGLDFYFDALDAAVGGSDSPRRQTTR